MLKQQNESGGVIKDYINTYFLLGLALFNFINQILEGKDILERSYLTIPFIVVSILIYIDKTSKTTKSIMFMGLGIVYQLSVPDQSYLGSTSFMIISFLQHANYRHGLGVITLSLVMIAVKATQSDATPSQTIVAIIAFSFIYINIYIIVNGYKGNIKKLNNYYIDKITKLKEDLNKAINGEIEPRRNIDAINITQEEKAILHLYCEGYDYNRIQKTLGLNIAPNSVRRKITAIKKENKNKILNGKSKETNVNDAQFGKWLYQKV